MMAITVTPCGGRFHNFPEPSAIHLPPPFLRPSPGPAFLALSRNRKLGSSPDVLWDRSGAPHVFSPLFGKVPTLDRCAEAQSLLRIIVWKVFLVSEDQVRFEGSSLIKGQILLDDLMTVKWDLTPAMSAQTPLEHLPHGRHAYIELPALIDHDIYELISRLLVDASEWKFRPSRATFTAVREVEAGKVHLHADRDPVAKRHRRDRGLLRLERAREVQGRQL